MQQSDLLKFQYEQFQKFQQQQFEQLQQFQKNQWEMSSKPVPPVQPATPTHQDILNQLLQRAAKSQLENSSSPPRQINFCPITNKENLPRPLNPQRVASSQTPTCDQNQMRDILQALFAGNQPQPHPQPQHQAHPVPVHRTQPQSSQSEVPEFWKSLLSQIPGAVAQSAQPQEKPHPQTKATPAEANAPRSESQAQAQAQTQPQPKEIRLTPEFWKSLLSRFQGGPQAQENQAPAQAKPQEPVQAKPQAPVRVAPGAEVKTFVNTPARVNSVPVKPKAPEPKPVDRSGADRLDAVYNKFQELSTEFETSSVIDTKSKRYFEGRLMQLLLELDEMKIAEALKPSRKDLVSKINRMLDSLDNRHSSNQGSDSSNDSIPSEPIAQESVHPSEPEIPAQLEPAEESSLSEPVVESVSEPVESFEVQASASVPDSTDQVTAQPPEEQVDQTIQQPAEESEPVNETENSQSSGTEVTAVPSSSDLCTPGAPDSENQTTETPQGPPSEEQSTSSVVNTSDVTPDGNEPNTDVTPDGADQVNTEPNNTVTPGADEQASVDLPASMIDDSEEPSPPAQEIREPDNQSEDSPMDSESDVVIVDDEPNPPLDADALNPVEWGFVEV